jgi:hypothetical protein
MNTIIKVDRKIPVIPHIFGKMDNLKFIRPELHYGGPVEYDLAKLRRINIATLAQQHGINLESLWLVTKSQGPIPDRFCFYRIFKFLLTHNLLKDCLDLNDSNAIKEQVKPVIFNQLFLKDRFLLWKSAHNAYYDGETVLQIPFFAANSYGFEYDAGGKYMTPDILMYP